MNYVMNKLRLFGTSGIRGKAKTQITTKLAKKIGLTFASFIGNKGTVVVGRDVRLTAKALSTSLISGLILGGINVEDCGVTPTPAVLWTLKKKKLDAAIVVTGSHTPKDIIGFLFFNKDTSELSEKDSLKFEQLFFNKITHVPAKQVGKQNKIEISNLYLKSILEQVNINKISSLNATIVLDPGNGPSSNYISKIFEATNVKTVIINGEPNGSFPNRDPYPRPEVLGSLSKKVREAKADLGSATDGDGDRTIFSDDQGKILWGDQTAAIFIKDTLKKTKGGVVVAPINSSRLINWICDNNNGKLVFSKVGPPAIIESMKKEKAIMGIEETGKIIFTGTILYGDWILSTLKMLEIIKDMHCSLSDLAKTFPQYYMKKTSYSCPEQLKQFVLKQALKEWQKRKEKAKITTIDGLRIDYLDGSWILFRPSGTEPVFRVYTESTEESRTKELAINGSKIINKSLQVASMKQN